jgi:uncharacterized membrane protein
MMSTNMVEQSQEDKEDSWTVLNKVIWESNSKDKRISELMEKIRQLTIRNQELEEIEQKRVKEHDFKPASSVIAVQRTDQITFPAKLFTKLVQAGGTHKDVKLKISEWQVEEVIKQ